MNFTCSSCKAGLVWMVNLPGFHHSIRDRCTSVLSKLIISPTFPMKILLPASCLLTRSLTSTSAVSSHCKSLKQLLCFKKLAVFKVIFLSFLQIFFLKTTTPRAILCHKALKAQHPLRHDMAFS